MCGITGLWHLDQNRTVSPQLIHQMTSLLRHRGPDDEGYLFANTATGCVAECGGPDTVSPLNLPDARGLDDTACFNLAFGFRRLSIIDVSPAGHQPMSTADGLLWLVYNGEIYNYLELRAELEAKGYSFKTATDTEVILYAYREWGADCLQRFNGMWAFALWDAQKRQLFCARDRFGIKPFYYVWDGETFAFASEIKALLQLPDLPRRPNNSVIYDYLRSGGLDYTGETFFENILQLPAAHHLTLQNNRLAVSSYWDLDLPGAAGPPQDESAYAQEFYHLFEDAIRLHLRSDVPVGTCLSGGLDSSAIVVVANNLLFNGNTGPEIVGRQQKTFSSCFDDPRFDERQYIEPVLAATGAERNFTFPSAQKLMQAVPRLIWHHDEPFPSTSIFAQWSVMELAASRGVKVLLDGQGGDELLAGYQPCFDFYWGSLLRQGHWGELGQDLAAYRRLFDSSLPGLAARTARTFAPVSWQGMVRRARAGGTLGLNPEFARTYRRKTREFVYRGRDPFRHYLYDLTRYGLPRLLRFEDRNSMAHSIEARVPFLDYRLVEFSFALPAEQKIKRGLTKVVLRNALRDVLPEPIRMRTNKMGFVTPEQTWLANELYDWLYAIITSESFQNREYFDAPQILQALQAHAAGQRDISALAWRWVNLELWLRQMIENRSASHNHAA